MKTTVTFQIILFLLLFNPSFYSKPDFNGTAAGCSGSGCHTFQSGILTATAIGNLQVRIALSGTTSKVAGEIVDGNGNVVAYINSTSSNPFILTAASAGTYVINAGYKNPSLKWDSKQVDITLPVELVSFSAKVNNNSVNLTWSTATETNNLGFEIERSRISNEWEKIGFVSGAGNSSSPKNYSYSDNNLFPGKYSYRLKQIDVDGAYEYSSIVEVVIDNPKQFELKQNYPNPFNPVTKIPFQISTTSKVSIAVYDLLGKEIVKLLDEERTPGYYEIAWNPIGLPSGIYYYQIQAGSFVDTKQMILLR